MIPHPPLNRNNYYARASGCRKIIFTPKWGDTTFCKEVIVDLKYLQQEMFATKKCWSTLRAIASWPTLFLQPCINHLTWSGGPKHLWTSRGGFWGSLLGLLEPHFLKLASQVATNKHSLLVLRSDQLCKSCTSDYQNSMCAPPIEWVIMGVVLGIWVWLLWYPPLLIPSSAPDK